MTEKNKTVLPIKDIRLPEDVFADFRGKVKYKGDLLEAVTSTLGPYGWKVLLGIAALIVLFFPFSSV